MLINVRDSVSLVVLQNTDNSCDITTTAAKLTFTNTINSSVLTTVFPCEAGLTGFVLVCLLQLSRKRTFIDKWMPFMSTNQQICQSAEGDSKQENTQTHVPVACKLTTVAVDFCRFSAVVVGVLERVCHLSSGARLFCRRCRLRLWLLPATTCRPGPTRLPLRRRHCDDYTSKSWQFVTATVIIIRLHGTSLQYYYYQNLRSRFNIERRAYTRAADQFPCVCMYVYVCMYIQYVCMCNYSYQTTEPICIKIIPANRAFYRRAGTIWKLCEPQQRDCEGPGVSPRKIFEI